jgi:hypothetical protein
MEDIGNIVFYIILAVIAIAGSIQSSKKKKTTGKTAPPRPPERRTPEPAGQTRQQRRPLETRTPEPVRQVVSQPRPQYASVEPVDEGYYEDPLAASFAGEGSVSRNSAAAFADEGSVSRNSAAAFSDEGSVENTMATAFAMEGAPALDDLINDEFSHIDITDSEISDAPGFDYNTDDNAEQMAEGFNLKQAVIFSAILNRKEYSF